MDFRLINENSLDQIKNLWGYCFEKADSPFFQWYFKEYALRQNKILGGFMGPKLQTMVHLNPFIVQVRKEKEKMPYLVAVATDPEARGQHAISGLLQTSFALAKAMGSKAVLLQPIYAGIYQPYGFSYTYMRTAYKMPLMSLDLPHIDDSLQVGRITPQEGESILPGLYACAMASYNGYTVRDARVWHNYLAVSAGEKTEVVVVRREDKPVGYALYNRNDETITVLELLAVDGAAHNRLLAYIKGFAGTFKKLDWLGAVDDTFYLNFKDAQYAPRIAPFMMGRVIDVPAVLQGLTVPAGEPASSLVLFVQDEFIKSNNLLLQLNISPQGVELMDTIKVPDITMDISTFTQLYFGTYSVEQLWANGKIMVEDQKKLQILSRLLPAQKNYINEYF